MDILCARGLLCVVHRIPCIIYCTPCIEKVEKIRAKILVKVFCRGCTPLEFCNENCFIYMVTTETALYYYFMSASSVYCAMVSDKPFSRLCVSIVNKEEYFLI